MSAGRPEEIHALLAAAFNAGFERYLARAGRARRRRAIHGTIPVVREIGEGA